MQASIPDHVLLFQPRGTLQRDDIREFDRQIQAKLAHHERIGVVANVEDLQGMTFGAVMQDIAAELKYLGDWDRFPRMALVASRGFLKSAAETVGKILPRIEVRTFEPAEIEQAVAFAASFEGQASESQPAR